MPMSYKFPFRMLADLYDVTILYIYIYICGLTIPHYTSGVGVADWLFPARQAVLCQGT